MARIRTIKPDFWTDEKIVQLPYVARLAFIGLWNFADDEGLIWDEPERLRMQVLPNDQENMASILDLLSAIELIEKIITVDGKRLIRIPGFDEHQKISNKSPSKISLDNSRKVAIPLHVRRGVALKYGCEPGETKEVECYCCGTPGKIYWHKHWSGLKPSTWVSFDLELDHFDAEFNGGETKIENLVLSCRTCNRSKGIKDTIPFICKKSGISTEDSRDFCLELEGKGNGSEGKEKNTTQAPNALASEPKKQKKLTQMPENWSPNDAHRTKCRELGFDPAKLAEQFGNHHASKGSKFVDWDRAFFTWIGNAENYRAKQTGRGSNQQSAASIAEAGLRVAARYSP